jgi:hypothetical protein
MEPPLLTTRALPAPLHVCLQRSAFVTQPEDDSENDSQDDWAVRVSDAHQAVLPALRPRPAEPTEGEARFLQPAPVCAPCCAADKTVAAAAAATASAAGLLPPVLAPAAKLSPPTEPAWPSAAAQRAAHQDFAENYISAGSSRARRALLTSALAEADSRLGAPLVQELGLLQLGERLRASWQPHEEVLFALGMIEKYRAFRMIQRR